MVVEVKLGCSDLLKSPTSIRITHRHIDGHRLRSTMIAFMCGLPISQGHDVIRFGHAGYVVRLRRVIKLMGEWLNVDAAVIAVEDHAPKEWHLPRVGAKSHGSAGGQ